MGPLPPLGKALFRSPVNRYQATRDFYVSGIALVHRLAQTCFLFDLPVMHLLPATRQRISLLPSPAGEGVTSFRVTDEELYNLVL